jgi:hypothetical protein
MASRFSVIIAFYNHEPFVQDGLDSIRRSASTGRWPARVISEHDRAWPDYRRSLAAE